MEALDAREGRARGDGIDKDEAFAIANPLVAQGGVLFLAGGVEDFEHAGLAVYDYLFAVGVFDCWIVSGRSELAVRRESGWKEPKEAVWREGTYVSTKCCKHS